MARSRVICKRSSAEPRNQACQLTTSGWLRPSTENASIAEHRSIAWPTTLARPVTSDHAAHPHSRRSAFQLPNIALFGARRHLLDQAVRQSSNSRRWSAFRKCFAVRPRADLIRRGPTAPPRSSRARVAAATALGSAGRPSRADWPKRRYPEHLSACQFGCARQPSNIKRIYGLAQGLLPRCRPGGRRQFRVNRLRPAEETCHVCPRCGISA